MKYRSGILKLALFATGMSGIVAEYVLSTLATYFLGDSVFQWTMIVSVMLFSMGLGSRLSKQIKTRLLLNFITIEFVLSILTAFVTVIIYLYSAHFGDNTLMIYGMSIVVGVLIGMEIPLVIRLNEEYQELRVNVSSSMENDYYGSLAGGVFFAFIGLPFIGLTYTPFILGTVNFLVALLLIGVLYRQLEKRPRRAILFAATAVCAVLLVGVLVADSVINYGEQLRYRDKIVYEKQSKYQKIVMTTTGEDFFLFINGNQQLCSMDEVLYHEPLVHPVMQLAPMPRHVLIMGGGDGGAAREVLKYPGVEKVVLVDLDPVMTELGREHPLLVGMNQHALNDGKVTIINQDGFIFLEETREFFDVIIVDLPDPKTVELGRLYSKEFYSLCYRRLKINGTMITQAGSPYYAARAFNCIDKTMEAAGFATLPIHNQVVTMGEWGWVLGAKSIPGEQLKEVAQRLTFEGIPTQWLNSESMTLMTSFGKKIFPGELDSVRVNKIHDPVLYRYYLEGIWDIY